MKTSVMEVRDMLSVLSVLGVEQRIGEVPGVESVTVNYAAGSATVRFDETRLSLADIRSDVRQSGSKADAAEGGNKDPEAPDAPEAAAADSKAAAPKTPPAAASADAKPAGDAPPGSTPADKAAAEPSPATPKSSPKAPPEADAASPGKAAMKGM